MGQKVHTKERERGCAKVSKKDRNQLQYLAIPILQYFNCEQSALNPVAGLLMDYFSGVDLYSPVIIGYLSIDSCI
ncbi:MAG: hypothetical protein DRH50_09690, partial [Deltaproteobacteria bacterium]